MTRIALLTLFAIGCASTTPAPRNALSARAPIPLTPAPARKPHPMVGHWEGTMRMELRSPGAPARTGEQPFTLTLNAAPTSFGGGGNGSCDLRATPDGDDAVRFPAGQICRAHRDGMPMVSTLREGRMLIVDGHLLIELDFDVDDGSALVVRADLARGTRSDQRQQTRALQ